MSFTAQLETDFLVVEAGANTPLSLEIANRSDATDQFEVEIEGLDPEWTAIPVASFSVSARASHRAIIFFKPARNSENVAGNYPFVLKIRSLETGEVRTVQGALQIKPYFHLSMEMAPKKGTYSPTGKNNEFVAALVNLGNSELNLQVFGSDPEDSLTYQFGTEQLSLGPGQQREVVVTVTPTRKRAISSPILHGFTISVRSPENVGVVAAAQAQLEQKPLLSPGGLILGLIGAFLAFFWWWTLPKAPVLDTFTVNKSVIIPGEMVSLTWTSSNAKRVRILFGSEVIVEGGRPNGSMEYRPPTSGKFLAVAVRDTRSSTPLQVNVDVRAPAKAPPAEITRFEIPDRQVEPGQKFMVNYKVSGAVKVVIMPTQTLLDPTMDSIQLEAPSEPGTVNYQLKAVNASGDAVDSKQIRVSFGFTPKARITAFQANPEIVEETAPQTTIRWAVENTSRAELQVAGQKIDLSGSGGTVSVDILQSGDIVLVAYDERGLATRRKLTVRVKKTQPPVDDSSPPPTDNPGENKGIPPITSSTGTTGTTTGTTGTTKTGGNR